MDGGCLPIEQDTNPPLTVGSRIRLNWLVNLYPRCRHCFKEGVICWLNSLVKQVPGWFVTKKKFDRGDFVLSVRYAHWLGDKQI